MISYGTLQFTLTVNTETSAEDLAVAFAIHDGAAALQYAHELMLERLARQVAAEIVDQFKHAHPVVC